MKILSVFGTRPEAIKMAPVIHLLNHTAGIEHKTCSTGQHHEMLNQVLDFFEIKPDYELNIMQKSQDLTDITAGILQGIRPVLHGFRPDWVLVHGDTTTCFATTLAAFYVGIKVGHVEAGLRTGNLGSPFPEEANRILTDKLASVFFAPTQGNADNLLREGTSAENILITGNTVIDALLWANKKVHSFSDQVPISTQGAFQSARRILLVTGHRRENFGAGFESICKALIILARRFPDLQIIYPVHLNPKVQTVVYSLLSNIENIHLTAPLGYPDFVLAMRLAWVILTDSGGIQEEAPSLGKPVLVMRDTTERQELLDTGAVRMVGTDTERIVQAVSDLWHDDSFHHTRDIINPSGTGKSAEKIVGYFMNSD